MIDAAHPAPIEDEPESTLPTSADDDEAARAYTAAYARAFAIAQATLEGRLFGDVPAFGAPDGPDQDVDDTERPDPDNAAAHDRSPHGTDAADAAASSGSQAAAGPVAAEPGWNRLTPVLVAVAILVLALVLAAVAWWPRPDDAPAVSPARSALPAGVSLPANGSYVRVRVLADTDLQVDQWIRGRPGLTGLRLSVPDVAGLDPGSVAASRVLLRHDGTRAKGPSVVDSGRQVSYRFAKADQLHLSYRLSGAVERTGSGRALARVLGLTVAAVPQLGPGVVSVQGAKVLSLACSAPTARAVPEPCGAPRDDTWQVTLRAPDRTDRVLASLQLR